jgi:hypothetical protein
MQNILSFTWTTWETGDSAQQAVEILVTPGALAVVGLAQLERDRQPVGINEGVDS